MPTKKKRITVREFHILCQRMIKKYRSKSIAKKKKKKKREESHVGMIRNGGRRVTFREAMQISNTPSSLIGIYLVLGGDAFAGQLLDSFLGPAEETTVRYGPDIQGR